MATSVHISISEYLQTTYRPDREYVDGELLERNVGKRDHARIQALLTMWFGNHEQEWNVIVATELRVQVAPTRIRIPDVCLVSNGRHPPVLVEPPLLTIEILSPDDTYVAMTQRCNDYIRMAVRTLWIVDPSNRTGHMWVDGAWIETTGLHVPDSSIHLDLKTIYDRLEATN